MTSGAFQLTWHGDQVIEQIASRLTTGLQRFDEQLAGEARSELYPGHGYLTGALQAALAASGVHRDGDRLVGAVGAYGVAYGLLVHGKYYRFILDPFERMRPNAVAVITGG